MALVLTFAANTGRALSVAVALSLALLTPRIASAQEATVDNTAAARALFQQGLELLEEERWEEAADRFQRALVLRPSPQITYNLTTALIELGRLVRASELLRQVTLDPTVEPEVRAAAEGRRAEIQPRLASLTVIPSEDLGAVDIFLNEQILQGVLVGVPFPVDPGRHVVTARRDGEVLASQEVILAEGESTEVRLTAPTVALDEPPPVEPGDEDEPRRSVASRWWLWTLVGVVVVGAGLGLGLGLGLQDHPADPLDGLGGTIVIGGER